jgi:FdhE protein
MAGGFLRRLFGATAPSPEFQAALAELERLGQERPAWSGPIATLTAILPALQQEPTPEPAPGLTAEQATTKLAGGVPLLRGESLTLDAKPLRQRWQRICTALQDQPGGAAASALAEVVRRGRLDLPELAREVLAGRPEQVHALADQAGLDAALTATVLRLTLFPILTRVAASLAPLRQGSRWEQGYCPTCGSWPLLGEYRGLEQLRFLRCGLCASAWEFPRLGCPYCGTRDHQVLGYFHVEGEEARHRAATCDACRGYVKMVTTLAALDELQLLITDLATVHLDLAAAERGYSPPA